MMLLTLVRALDASSRPSFHTTFHQDRRGGGRGGKRSRARAPKEPVDILCQKVLLLLYTSAVHFYGNSTSLIGYLQELSTLMTVSMSETKPSY